MATDYTFKGIVNDLLQSAGQRAQVSSVSTPTDAGQFFMVTLNMMQQYIASMKPWDWLRTQGEVAVLGDDTTTATASSGSASVTLGSAILDTGSPSKHLGAYCVFTGIPDIYIIGAVGSSTTLTLTQTLPSALSGASTTIYQPRYALPADFDRALNTQGFVTSPWRLDPQDPEQFFQCPEARSAYASAGPPANLTLWGQTTHTTPRRQMWLDKPPSQDSTLNIHYYRKIATMTADGDLISLPNKLVPALKDLCLSEWYRDREPNLAKRQMYLGAAYRTINRHIGQSERTSDFGAIAPGGLTRSDFL